jgi:glycolate oxidase subunit GlcD
VEAKSLIAQGVIKELTRIVGRDNILHDRKDLIAYSYDATPRQEMPEVIVFPRSTADVSAIMKVAQREKLPVIARGAGTNLSGGTVPIMGGIILEMSRMNRILEIDTANRRAVVEPGVVNLDLQNALAPMGFFYPPDPASQKSSTLGGNVGENAGGPLCLRYGVTSKYVCGMEVVLADGEVVDIGDYVDEPPGYDLRGLLIGSEGILGVATKLILHIIPKPEATRTMLVIFDKLDDSGQAVSDIISAGIIPAALELLDKKMCWVIEQSVSAGYPTDAEGVLLIEVSGLADTLEKQVNEISEICQRNQAREIRIAQTNAERDILWKGRRGAFGAVARICPPYSVCDGTVPRDKMADALRKVGEVAEKYKVIIANVAHAGDGNLHPLILFDAKIPEEREAAKKAGEEILDYCIAYGGTITGEHGIGLEKMDAMPHMFDPADMSAMRHVKRVFDPEDILNPGKMLPPEEEESPAAREEVLS